MPRWITVANRLPFSLNTSEDGKKKIVASSGGLVSALNGVHGNEEKVWIGCSPDGVGEKEWPKLHRELRASSKNKSWEFEPLFLSPDLYDSYYNGCCNDVLWPLFHYQPEIVSFDAKTWKAYQDVNEQFAFKIAETARPDDLIWIHDFHLFLVPKILKKLRPELRVGFFLHIPFPSSEVFRQLPAREEILSSLLECDLIGFHDYSYLRHFSSSVLRLLGIEAGFLSIQRGSHTTRLGVFPVSIDTDMFARRTREPKIKSLASEMKQTPFLFLGIDRTDYIKGLDLKLKAFRQLIKNHPEYREKVSLLQVAVPTRTGVPVYMDLAREIAQLVGEINGEFSTPQWTPIHYIHASVSSEQLIALYRAADALVVTSKRDGMNLVALEYLACQSPETPGVVLLSEFAGAISILSHTIPVNPWDFDDTAEKMKIAIEMPKEEKISRMSTMQERLRKYTSTDWAHSFIAELEKQTPDVPIGPALLVNSKGAKDLADRVFAGEPKPQRAALFIDYDGTLVPIELTPDLAQLPAWTKKEIESLLHYSWLDVVIVSGRDSNFLSRQFAGLPVHIAAEHGAKYFNPNEGRWKRRAHRSRASWYPAALKIISDYTSRVPLSQIEKKSFAIAWHYRQSPTEYGELQARKLAEELELGLANLPVSILRGKKVIEVRAIEADKGIFASEWLENASVPTAGIAFGDDRTDEDLFGALRGRGISIKVGTGCTVADAMLSGQSEVIPMIQLLIRELSSRFKCVGPVVAEPLEKELGDNNTDGTSNSTDIALLSTASKFRNRYLYTPAVD
jgi:trehalose 6-phosphate synthase/phosphatase